MYIIRKKNTSGSISIYILEKQNGKQKLIKSMGSANAETDISQLESLARKEIEKLTKQKAIEFTYDQDEHHISFVRKSIQAVRIVGTELVLVNIFNEIGFNQVPEKLLRHLVISRLLYPGSKLRTIEYLSRHYQEHYPMSSVYRYLDKLNQGPHCPQIVLGLLVTTGGYPLAFEMFEGNKYEGETLIPVLEHFKRRYDPGKLVVVADAGLLSKSNIEQLLSHGYEFILGARIKNETKELKDQIISKKWASDTIHEFEKEELTKLIVSYSEKRARKDAHNRDNGIKRLEKRIISGKLTKENINNKGYNKFLKIEGNATISLDLEKISSDSRWDGLKGYITNASLNPKEVIEQYRQLWQIEKAFRISKTDLKVRPIYHRKASRIETHLLIAFCSYKLYKEFERQLVEKHTGLTPEKALDILKSIYGIKTTLPVSNKTVEIVMANTKEQKKLLSAFNIEF
jgi:transposase